MNQLKPIINTNNGGVHSISSVIYPQCFTNNSAFQPIVRLKTLNLHSASTFHIPSMSINKCFHGGPKVILSPLNNSIRRNAPIIQRLLTKRLRVYPGIFKCNSNRCRCCNFLSCKSTIRSTVNNRVFSVKLLSDIR